MKLAGSPVSLPGCVEIPHDSMNSTVAWTVSNGSVPPNSGDSSLDDITVGTTLGAAANAGACIMQAAAESASNTSALPLSAPYAVVGDSYDVVANTNIFAEAWLIGVIKEAVAPIASDEVKAAVPGVVFI